MFPKEYKRALTEMEEAKQAEQAIIALENGAANGTNGAAENGESADQDGIGESQGGYVDDVVYEDELKDSEKKVRFMSTTEKKSQPRVSSRIVG